MSEPAGSSLAVGDEVEVDVTAIAHGGHGIARHLGQVLFVRHAIPGERVRARVTESGAGSRFVRADAVEVVAASPDRVEPPCPYAGPGRCGGCDFQHVGVDRQRALKGEVVREQFARLAHLEVDVEVEALPGPPDGLGWRTRVEYAVADDASVGLRAHRSHEVIPVDRCAITVADPVHERVTGASWSGFEGVDVVVPSVGDPVIVPVPEPAGGVPVIHERVEALGRELEVSARGFWQVHPAAADTFVDAVLTMLDPQPGERALDLYAGVGLFAAAVASRVGPGGQVLAVESEREATAHARANLAAYRNCVVIPGRVDDVFGVPRAAGRGPNRRRVSRPRKSSRSPQLPTSADLVVLDPPRTGAGRGVCEAIASLSPRAIAYVACDPAALARDTAYLAGFGYQLAGLRAFDAFPMTHHVESIAHFVPVGAA